MVKVLGMIKNSLNLKIQERGDSLGSMEKTNLDESSISDKTFTGITKNSSNLQIEERVDSLGSNQPRFQPCTYHESR